MSRIVVKGVRASFGTPLFQNVSFSFGEGDRIGVVGNNAGGKSTLLRIVAGLAEPDEGLVLRPKGTRIGYVGQTVPPELLTDTLRAAVLNAIPESEREASEWRADLVLESFGAPEDMRDRPLSQLSGGWQRLALIGGVWASEPDVLLIDEPTNHLDLQKILLLERWLNSEVLNTPVLLVSHDRRFLDTCTNSTLFLRPGESRTYSYSFSRARELLAEEDRSLQNKKENELRELQRLRKSAHNLRRIGVDNYSSAALRKSIQIAKRADAIERSLPETHVEQRRDIKLTSSTTHAKRVIGIEDLMIRRPDGVPLFRIPKLDIAQGDRVVVLGRNGTGKTQLIRRLKAAFANPESARADGITIAPSAILGYIDQDMSQLPPGETLRDYVSAFPSTGQQRAISLLVAAGFPVVQHTLPISALSPGQKARLALLTLRLLEPNVYLMDEPTNHVDITGQEQLEMEILAHVATAVLVSHDRTFVENTGTRFLVIDNGSISEIDSPMSFYDSLLVRESG